MKDKKQDSRSVHQVQHDLRGCGAQLDQPKDFMQQPKNFNQKIQRSGSSYRKAKSQGLDVELTKSSHHQASHAVVHGHDDNYHKHNRYKVNDDNRFRQAPVSENVSTWLRTPLSEMPWTARQAVPKATGVYSRLAQFQDSGFHRANSTEKSACKKSHPSRRRSNCGFISMGSKTS